MTTFAELNRENESLKEQLRTNEERRWSLEEQLREARSSLEKKQEELTKFIDEHEEVQATLRTAQEELDRVIDREKNTNLNDFVRARVAVSSTPEAAYVFARRLHYLMVTQPSPEELESLKARPYMADENIRPQKKPTRSSQRASSPRT